MSYSSVFTFIFLLLIALSLAYVGGVMMGRQMQRQASVDRHLPAAPELPERVEQQETPPADILKPEELVFARVLRGEEAPRIQASAEPAAPPAQSEGGAESPEPQAGAVDAATYDYVFQMGAFRDEAAVDALRQVLEGYGFRTGMQKAGKVFLVLVRLRGDGARVAELGALAEKLRLGAPVTLSRKAVQENAPRPITPGATSDNATDNVTD